MSELMSKASEREGATILISSRYRSASFTVSISEPKGLHSVWTTYKESYFGKSRRTCSTTWTEISPYKDSYFGNSGPAHGPHMRTD